MGLLAVNWSVIFLCFWAAFEEFFSSSPILSWVLNRLMWIRDAFKGAASLDASLPPRKEEAECLSILSESGLSSSPMASM